jgi:LysM repeat protein
MFRSATASATTPGEIAVRAARTQLGVPYVWDGQKPGVAFDCSGLTAWAWAQAGVSMDSYTVTQAASFREVAANELLPGDLVLNRKLEHVVIYSGSGRCIEARATGTVVQEGPMSIARALCIRPTLAPIRVTPSGLANGREIYIATAKDTLYGIAVSRSIDLLPLARMNNLSPSSPLWRGDRIVVPALPTPIKQVAKPVPPVASVPAPVTPSTPTTPVPPPMPAAPAYTVRSGDSLSAIAARNGTTVDRLVKLNGITNPNLIQIGQVLKLA